MSVCVTVRTKNILSPVDYIKHLSNQGEQIVITSNEYPTACFGTHKKAIRGVTVSKVENGLEVRVNLFSSEADYLLFAKTVDAIMMLTGDCAYLEDDDDEAITAPLDTFNTDWIEQQIDAGFNIACALIRHSGHPIIMDGLFTKICLGAKLFQLLHIPLQGETHKFFRDRFLKHLCTTQWDYASLKDTSTHLAIAPKDGGFERSLSLSCIYINNNKVVDFDYISYADLFGIFDMDNERNCIIPFSQLWKILPDDKFSSIDELQYRCIGEVTVDTLYQIMEQARYLEPIDLHYKPTYPGEGYDEQQNTFILMWNPDISSITLNDHQESIANMLTQYFNWDIWEYDKAKCGDRFFLVKVGSGNRGIVMSGVLESHPFEANDWRNKDKHRFYADIRPNVALDPEQAPMLTVETLQEAIPSFDWTGGHSGRMLKKEDAQTLELLWATFLSEHADNADGVTMNVIHPN